MCSLCAALGAARHWTDAAGRPEFARGPGGRVTVRDERTRRVAILRSILSARGIDLRDWGGNSYVLKDRAGRTGNVWNLGGIWAEADRLGEDALDLLDPDLLDRLEAAP